MFHWMIKKCAPNKVIFFGIISTDKYHRQRPDDVLVVGTRKAVNFFINKFK